MNQTIKHPILSRNGFKIQIPQTIRHPTQNNLTSLEKQNKAISHTYYGNSPRSKGSQRSNELLTSLTLLGLGLSANYQP